MSRTPTVLCAAIGAVLIAGAVLAQPAPPTPPAPPAPPAPPMDEDRLCEREGDRTVCRVVRMQVQGRARVGVVLAPDARGVRVIAVTPDGPAAQAGVASGDRILAIGGSAIEGDNEDARLARARAQLQAATEGRAIALRIERDGAPRTVEVTPRAGLAPLAWEHADGPRRIVLRPHTTGHAAPPAPPALMDWEALPADAVHVIRALRHGPGCTGAECPAPMVMEAFRWNGLNLASVDARLGRYFGTDRGVLVLGAGDVLAPLEPGDVIQRIDDAVVTTPREAMDALRGTPAMGRVRIAYLRDRAARTAEVTVPRMPRWDAIAPPLPPAPPAPPAPPTPPAPRALSALPAPPAPPAAPPPPPPPPAGD